MSDMEEYTQEHIKKLVHEQAEKLRRMADELDHSAKTEDTFRLVEDAVHTVAWGVANLNTSTLIYWLKTLAVDTKG